MTIASGEYLIGDIGAGDDYATAITFEADIEATLTGAIVGVLRDKEHAHGDVDFSGHTTTAANFITLTAGSDTVVGGGTAGSAFKAFDEYQNDADFHLRYGVGIAGGAGARIKFDNWASLGCADDHTMFSRLQITNNGASGSTGAIVIGNGATGAVANRCIVERGTLASLAATTAGLDTYEDDSFFNCLSIVNRGDLGLGAGLRWSAGLRFCTIVRPSDHTPTTAGREGVKRLAGTGTFLAQGCAVFNFASNAFDTTYVTSGDYNASDDTSGPGANDQDNLTYADQFENADSGDMDFRLKPGNGLAGQVTRDSTYTTDILGNERPGGALAAAIGCVEPVVADPAFPEELLRRRQSTLLRR